MKFVYDFATIAFDILFVVLIFGAGAYAAYWWKSNAPVREQVQTRKRFAEAPTIHDPGEEDAHTANQTTLKAMGMPTIDAGRIIRNVPSIDPSDPTVSDYAVLTNTRINAITPTGEKIIDFFELEKGMAIFLKGGKAFILQPHRLTAAEESYLSDQRISLIKSNDNIIESFCGHAWKIKGAMGDFQGRKSTARILTTSPQLNEAGMTSVLPPDLLASKSDNYYDLEAVNEDTEQVLVAMYFLSAGSWSCYIGHQLNEEQIALMKGI